LFDEVDTWQNRDDLQAVLNASFQQGGTVRRMEREGDNHKSVDFPVFAPIVLAGIRDNILSDATRDRAFSIQLVRQTQDERRERFRERLLHAEIAALQTDIAAWVESNRTAILEHYNEPDYLTQFRDRTVDVAEPLAAILEVACPNRLSDFLEAVAKTRCDNEKAVREHRVLTELAQKAGQNDPLIGNASELAGVLDLDPPIQAIELGAVLHRYGFETKSTRLGPGDSSRYRYVLSAAELRECCQRFVVSNADGGTTNASEPA